ncbi:YbaN family protein [Celeribacter litoreus]|uniref:YbaN family protein n=1 Tax=Celeribacter litoreus TaxID=2876714 RepID=UPI001CCC9B49|nr:YbaN family protein [Celeribacter litoreus]MCA0045189.1 YbaN family protein [Celeribacter litoreus]
MTERLSRYIHFSLGALCIALGFIGIFLPVMPTTVFILLAAFFFTKGSPRVRQWLLDHAHFGPSIRAWEETGAIPRRIKWIAISMMAVTFGVCLFFLPPLVLTLQAALMIIGALYILTRPDA